MTPTELIVMADQRNLEGISITDHDTVDGTQEALAAGSAHGIQVIPGIELSVYLGDLHFHLLGYSFNWADSSLLNGLKQLQDSRKKRNRAILDKLKTMGIDVSDQELSQISGSGQTGRPHIARLLISKKVVKNIDQAFTHYLKKGACAYVSRFILHVEQAIELIHGAGGAAVLAHPAQISFSIPTLDRLLAELKKIGLDGVEIYYPTQKGKFRNRLVALAARYGFLETGGSDYHGDIRAGTSMAGGKRVVVPASTLEALLNYNTSNPQTT